MFIKVKTFDCEGFGSVECDSYINVDMIVSIEPELCYEENSHFYNHKVSVITTTHHYYYTYLSCDEIINLINQEKSLEAQAALSLFSF